MPAYEFILEHTYRLKGSKSHSYAYWDGESWIDNVAGAMVLSPDQVGDYCIFQSGEGLPCFIDENTKAVEKVEAAGLAF